MMVWLSGGEESVRGNEENNKEELGDRAQMKTKGIGGCARGKIDESGRAL
jgi:hypothetical protein